MTKNYFYRSPYFRSHTSNDCHLWCTYIKWPYLQFFGVFFFFNFSKFWFSKMSEGWKGKKGLNWEKNYVCLTQSQELYIKWLWFLVRMCKMMISLVVERGKKWPKITNFSLLYLRNCRSYHQDFDNDISRCFSLFF